MTSLISDSVLSFDVYGTLIDWESGIYTNLLPLLSQTSYSKHHVLHTFHALEKRHQSLHPDLPYSSLLAEIHPLLLSELNLPSPTSQQSLTFGESVGSWPAFPDTLSALHILQKNFKLVVLSNTDRDSFAATNAAQMPGVKFDAVLTAQDIGSYKPDERNFEYMVGWVEREWGVGKEGVLQTAQSQFHDHFRRRRWG
ncbi:MAG: hypothetical protein LQ350_005433 [Teloschistes chrysophthalmus]|nr:MAG: hypothetical protein LQ350_005433 [Niorma chrysophthalma]